MRFQRHLFICTNKRDPNDPRGCCSEKGSEMLHKRFKIELKERGLKSTIRTNSSGCLDACEFGATVVVYPDGIWYGGVTENDAVEIIERHIIRGEVVERLLIKDKRYLTLDYLHLLSDQQS